MLGVPYLEAKSRIPGGGQYIKQRYIMISPKCKRPQRTCQILPVCYAVHFILFVKVWKKTSIMSVFIDFFAMLLLGNHISSHFIRISNSVAWLFLGESRIWWGDPFEQLDGISLLFFGIFCYNGACTFYYGAWLSLVKDAHIWSNSGLIHLGVLTKLPWFEQKASHALLVFG